MPNSLQKRFDPWSIVVIALTLVFFAVALFIKGFTHELLLEAGVFLVSVKLIMLSHKNGRLRKERKSALMPFTTCCCTAGSNRH